MKFKFILLAFLITNSFASEIEGKQIATKPHDMCAIDRLDRMNYLQNKIAEINLKLNQKDERHEELAVTLKESEEELQKLSVKVKCN